MVWLLTSGSSTSVNNVKVVGLKKTALLTSAEAVNSHINSNKSDMWLKVLPDFHVGGLSILCRASLSGAGVYSTTMLKWSARSFVDVLSKSQATIVSVVPTQVYDLVMEKTRPTKHLRVMFVGGGALSESLYKQAVDLGWPILLTYGMTEASSQVATSSMLDRGKQTKPKAKLLKHMEARETLKGELEIRSLALMSMYAYCSEDGIDFFDPKKDGWLNTGDQGHVHGSCIEVFGRSSRTIKVLGELVNLSQQEALLEKMGIKPPFVILPKDDERKGSHLRLVVESSQIRKVNEILVKYNQGVAPYERLSGVLAVKEIPTSELGKPLYEKLIAGL